MSMQATMISNAAVLCLLLFSAGQLAAASKSFGGGGGYGEEAGSHQEVPDVLPHLPLLTPEKAWSYSFGPGVQDESPVTPSKSSSKSPEKAWSYGSEDESPTPATPSKSSTPETPSKSPTPETPYKSSTPASPSSSSTSSTGGKASTTPSATAATTPSKSSSPSSTPSMGGDKDSGAGASSSTKSKGYGSGTPSSSSTTPESSGKASASASGGSGGQQGGSTPSSSSTTPASSSSTPAGGGYGLDPAGEPEYGLNQKAIDDILKEHNAFRAKEHVPPLTWNATLAKFSQQYAEKTLKGPCKMVHSTSPYGENLMLGTGGITWKTTVDQWSDEKRSYHYGSNSCDAGKMCGHYTAVVWKGTTSVGCGRVKCDNGDTMIMCSYWPPGNYDGARPF